MPSSLNNVKMIYSNRHAFAALKEDGTVAAWGNPSYGGSAPSNLNNVKMISSTIELQPFKKMVR